MDYYFCPAKEKKRRKLKHSSCQTVCVASGCCGAAAVALEVEDDITGHGQTKQPCNPCIPIHCRSDTKRRRLRSKLKDCN